MKYLQTEISQNLIEEGIIQPDDITNSINEFPYPVISIPSYVQLIEVISFTSSHLSKLNYKLFFRGQQFIYDGNQYPSLHRKLIEGELYLKKHGLFNANGSSYHFDMVLYATLNKIIPLFEEYQHMLLQKLSEMYKDNTIRERYTGAYDQFEGILQHYGYQTRFLDVVDNLHSALWFSCFKNNQTQIKDDQEYGYLFVYPVLFSNRMQPGVYENENQRFINLREVSPYFSLRPHIQHATLLVNKSLIQPNRDFMSVDSHQFDYKHSVLYCLKIPISLLRRLFDTPKQSSVFHPDSLFPESDRLLELLFNLHDKKRLTSLNPKIEEIEEVLKLHTDSIKIQFRNLLNRYQGKAKKREIIKEYLSKLNNIDTQWAFALIH